MQTRLNHTQQHDHHRLFVLTVYQGINFLDVPSNDPFYNEIGKLSARGVTIGCGNGNYCPNDPVTP